MRKTINQFKFKTEIDLFIFVLKIRANHLIILKTWVAVDLKSVNKLQNEMNNR
jgi:hypothetical protein